MITTDKHNDKVAKLTLAEVYPHYIAKIQKKGRNLAELQEVMQWLTGFDTSKIEQLIAEKVTFKQFFEDAVIHPNAHLITGLICGYRIEEIDNKLMKEVRYLDKLVDELAKGRPMEKILRKY
jgi:hypothetical protein